MGMIMSLFYPSDEFEISKSWKTSISNEKTQEIISDIKKIENVTDFLQKNSSTGIELHFTFKSIQFLILIDISETLVIKIYIKKISGIQLENSYELHQMVANIIDSYKGLWIPPLF